MITLQSLNDLKESSLLGLTIGNFDGVHQGHRQLLSKIKNECLRAGHKFVVVTFIPHPQKILNPEKKRFLINSYRLRQEMLNELGVDYLIELPFTRDFSTLSAEEFLTKYLFCIDNLAKIYLGYDFAFGANKQGTFDVAKKLALPKGIEVEVQPKFEVRQSIVSSTLIREKLIEGKVGEVETLLSRPFSLEGMVVKGEGRGRKIGFPTANIQVAEDLMIPQKGVYITRTKYAGMNYNSITNIGVNPTFKDDESLSVETNLFDFDHFIYGENIHVDFLAKIRDEKKFSTVNDLIEQIKQDVEAAKLYLKNK